MLYLDDILEKLIKEGHMFDSSPEFHCWMIWRTRWIQPPITDPDDLWLGPYQDSTGYWHSGGFMSDLKKHGIDIDHHLFMERMHSEPPFFKLLRK